MNIAKISNSVQQVVNSATKKIAPNIGTPEKSCKLSGIESRANFFSTRGKAPVITKASIISDVNDDIPLLATKINNSFLIDFDSQTEIIYGLDALKYLKKTDKFQYDTQIIFPKKCFGVAHINKKNVNLAENSAIMLNAGAEAQIKTTKGYPMIIVTKRDYEWYERYGKKAENIDIRNKFDELTYYNSHSYNGNFSPNALLPQIFKSDSFLNRIGLDKNASGNNLLHDIYNKRNMLDEEDKKTIEQLKAMLDKLFERGQIQSMQNGYIKTTHGYNSEYFKKVLQEEGFSEKEIEILTPIFKQARQIKMESVFTRKNAASDYPSEIIEKMKKSGILYDNKKDADVNIYWKYHPGSEHDLKKMLHEKGFSQAEEELIVNNWKKANTTGYDLSGLKFLNDDVAVYSLNDKLNNWTSAKTDWLTNSTALASSKGETPFIGVSIVRNDGAKPETMARIRGGQEALHKHPNLGEKDKQKPI